MHVIGRGRANYHFESQMCNNRALLRQFVARTKSLRNNLAEDVYNMRTGIF